MTSDRTKQLAELAMRTVFAFADGDVDGLPPRIEFEGLSAAEEWGMLCAVLELIRSLGYHDMEPGQFVRVTELRPGGSPAQLLAAQLVACYCNGETQTAMFLFTAAPDTVAQAAAIEVIEMAAMLVRTNKRGGRRAS